MQLEMREKPHERDCVLEAWREEEGGRRCIACSYRIYEFPILKRSRRERERVGANHGRWNFGFPGFVHYEILPGVGRASSFEIFARDNSRRGIVSKWIYRASRRFQIQLPTFSPCFPLRDPPLFIHPAPLFSPSRSQKRTRLFHRVDRFHPGISHQATA